jgi:hypothetical protein
MDNKQKTPHGHPNSNSYVKNLRVLVFQMDRWIDGRTVAGSHRVLTTAMDDWSENLFALALVRAYACVR